MPDSLIAMCAIGLAQPVAIITLLRHASSPLPLRSTITVMLGVTAIANLMLLALASVRHSQLVAIEALVSAFGLLIAIRSEARKATSTRPTRRDEVGTPTTHQRATDGDVLHETGRRTGGNHNMLTGVAVMSLYIVGLNRLLRRRVRQIAETRSPLI